MRNVIFVANGKEFKTMAEAERENPRITLKLSNDYDAERTVQKGLCGTFGIYTGKLADGWKAPYQRI